METKGGESSFKIVNKCGGGEVGVVQIYVSCLVTKH